MIESPQIVNYGREASEVLATAIQNAKAANALAPVTVIVPSNFVGLSSRRLLGSGVLSTTGVVNVSFVTPFRLAEQLASDMLLSELPLTNPVLGAAVRRALATNPGPYAAVRDHHSTEVALAALFAELSNVDEAGLESIETEGEQAGKIAVDLYRAIKANLGGFHTEKELASAAADRSDLPELVAELGHVIWFLPAPTTAAMGRLIGRILADASAATVIVGVTGNAEADKPVWTSCYSADVHQPRVQPSIEPATADHIVSVTDADEEVRSVVRGVLELLQAGTAADRIAIFYPAPDPYVRILEQQLAAAGITANGPDRRRLADSVAGRTLLGALALPENRWRRDKVLALVSGAPVRHNDSAAHPSAWETLSRRAGVHRDLSDWETKLALHVSHVTEQIADLRPENERSDAETWRLQRLQDTIDDAQSLALFVQTLANKVAAVEKSPTWSTKCSAALDLLQSLLGPEHQHSFWPESEQDAFARVVDALTRFSALEELEPSPSAAVFQRALAAELDVSRSRNGRYGHGVMYGPLSAAVGQDLDAVFILGCAEGLLPAARRDDAVLPDRLREKSLDQIDLKRDRIHHQYRELSAALSAAPKGKRTLLFPRGDLRSSRNALPSRWLLDTASALAGTKVHATDFEALAESKEVPEVRLVSSYAWALRAELAASEADRDLAELAGHVAEGGLVLEHPLASVAGSGLRMQQARSSSDFSEYDGNLAGQPIPGMDERPASASRWESWATCGFKFFLASVLDLSERDDPESIEDISAMDRGKVVHAILEDFIRAALDEGWMPEPNKEWDAAARRRLLDIATVRFDEYERKGRTGRAIHWSVQKNDLLGVLDAFLVADQTFRAANGATPTLVELPFGMPGTEPLSIELDGGRTLQFRGFADRVDTTAAGEVIVSDYKTGGITKYKGLKDDPVQAGKTLQLGLYAEAALRETGLKQATSNYWLLEADAKDTRKGYRWTPDVRSRFIEVLTTITDGIEGGLFAATPGEWNIFRQTNESCTYCDFDSLCPRSRGDQAEAKAHAPELVSIRSSLDVEESA